MFKTITVPKRTIMTPGPVEVNPKVLQVMSNSILGQYDPVFLDIMNEVKELIKQPFGTKNEQAFAIDGSSRSGIEAAMIAILEKDDKVLIPAFGRFAYLLAEIAGRCGAEVVLLEKSWESPFAQQDIIEKVKEVKPKLVAMVHGETANGQIQDLDEIGAYCQANDVLLLVDMVATFAGVELKVDEWGVDIAIAGSQKCLSVAAGMSLVTFNKRIEKLIKERYQLELGLSKDIRNERFIQSNYLDLSQLMNYWNEERINHHTEATTLVYGVHEGLRLLLEEGLENVHRRHLLNNQAIVAGIKAMGLEIFGAPDTKMPTVTPVIIPDGVDALAVPRLLLEQFGVEIAGSFGELNGKIWRIGNMGYSSRHENVLAVLGALESVLIYYGADIQVGKAVKAALDVYL
ncbi:pyridoxal-phosphate-dependent aminotransferase family protein [Fundicoccus ignavus]|uniref:Aminotransferase class V-fold PLP-dependent enzyme n=1 Tax=Fundicoccus ignavus TaxID=2664442 RepID=A0A844CD30_9LACT|nr:alanine--glyoxylate aminotransferase family protein [Fundicoccus ignavus]MRJ47431.1 aminotransferase class V-fold PLP-dependent enzyme [Fundicoccus ignavus]